MKWPKSPTQSTANLFGYGTKSTMAQIVALTTTYLSNMKVGIDMMTPTIIIGSLADKRSVHDGPLSGISEQQTSWIGSLIYLFPPVGGVTASFVQDRYGHRTCMMLSNVANVLSVTSLVYADSPAWLYASSALMGFNVGFTTSFSISYSGEVCEPRLRGTLTSVTNLFYFGGYLCVVALYAVTVDWKLSVLFTVALPLCTTVALFTTPDSPMWLLSRGRTDDASRALRRLRGGATEEKCDAEFHDMVRYASETNAIDDSERKGETQTKTDCTHRDDVPAACRFLQPETLKPLLLLVVFIFFTNLLSGIPYTPYLISVFDTFGASFHPAWATTMYMASGVAGTVLTIFSVNRLGKRFLALCTMATCSACYLSIGTVGHFWPPSPAASWTKIVLFFTSTFFSSMGIVPIVWILMGELFPMKSKNAGAGFSSAAYFILCFLMTKFYLDLEAITGFYNTFMLFGAMGLVGVAFLYFQLPETENKTLNEISEHFKSKKTKTQTVVR